LSVFCCNLKSLNDFYNEFQPEVIDLNGAVIFFAKLEIPDKVSPNSVPCANPSND